MTRSNKSVTYMQHIVGFCTDQYILRSGHRLLQCTNRSRTASKKVHGTSQYRVLRESMRGTDRT